MTKKNWSVWDNDVEEPTGFEVIPDEPLKAKKQQRKKPPEKRIHVYMDWPESLKEEFDDLYYAKCRKMKKKNEILEEWCREGMANLRD
jgi:hypothetical protein